VDSHQELTNTLNLQEELNHFLTTHTLLKEENQAAATSNNLMLLQPLLDIAQLMEKLDYTNKLHHHQEDQFQFALMLHHGKIITVVF